MAFVLAHPGNAPNSGRGFRNAKAIRQFCQENDGGSTMVRTRNAHKPSGTTRRERISAHRWSGRVTDTSDAMDLEKDVFKSNDPKHIAASVKRSAERSHRRKAGPFQSAMSMLNFYANRARDNLSASHRKVLETAKRELRRLFHREPAN
jgi:hypothetical protein